MDHRIVDLHVHSTESDGTFTPEELAAEAKRAGLSSFALTDHDTFSGVRRAKAAAMQYGIELIPGVELSTKYYGKEIHIVGLFINENDTVFEETLAGFRKKRDDRNVLMVENLRNEGFDITMEALYEMFPDCVVTRAHIARFLLNRGYIKRMSTAFDKYIGDNCRDYVPREMITPMDACDLIQKNGGVSVLAHPVLYHMSAKSLTSLILDLKPHGLAALEALYSTYSLGEETLMKRIAKENGLFISGGSDFHGSNKPDIRLATGKGRLYIPYEILDNLKTIHASSGVCQIPD